MKANNITHLNYTFTKLEPLTDYKVNVIAKTKFKTSLEKHIAFTTKDAPLPSEFELKVINISPNEITIQWESKQEDTKQEDISFDLLQNDISIQKKYLNTTYTFDKLEANTKYSFKVVAINSFGKKLTKKIDLTSSDYETPSSFEISIDEISDESISFSWKNNSDLEYNIFVNSVLVAKNIKESKYNLTNLNAQSIYTIKIVATNKFGKSNFSEQNITTKEQTPIDVSFRAINIDQYAITVEWSSKNTLKYSLYLNNVHRGDYTNNSNKEFTNLDTDTSYTIKLIAKDDKDFIFEKEIIVQTKPEDTIADFNITEKTVSYRNIKLKWTEALSTDGEKLKYDIYRILKDGGETTAARSISGLEYELTNLRPNTAYTIKILALHPTKMISKYTKLSFNTLDYAEPSSFNIEKTNISETSIAIKWETPSVASGEKIGYTIYLNDKVKLVYGKDISNYVFNNLTPGTKYTVKIKAESYAHKTSFSSKEFTTIEAKKPVFNINSMSISQRGFGLSWTVSNASIDEFNYKVYINDKLYHSGSEASLLVKDLKSNTKHIVRLEATRDQDKFYTEKEINTLEYNKLSDFDILFKADKYSKLNIDWSSYIDLNYHNFPSNTFELYMDNVKFETKKEFFKYSLDNLKPETTYNFRLVIKYIDGTVAIEKDASFTTGKNIKPLISENIKINKIGFGSIEFSSFTISDKDDDLNNIEYSYYVNNIKIKNKGLIGGNLRGMEYIRLVKLANNNGSDFQLSHFESDTDYTFYIIATDKYGNEMKSKTIEFHTYPNIGISFKALAISTNMNIVGISYIEKGSIETIKEIMIKWYANGKEIFPRPQVYKGDIKIIKGRYYLPLDYSSLLKQFKTEEISVQIEIIHLDMEPISSSLSNILPVK